jgi:predicted SprT family Zn-dependent metalloprotease
MSSTADFAAKMAAELCTAAARQLLSEWQNANYTYFGSALRPPTIEIVESKNIHGRWGYEHRTLEISKDLVMNHPWRLVVEVLKHEMAHQYAHEVLDAIDETAHGEAFRKVCDRMGIDASATGLPQLKKNETNEEESRIIQRIARLMALAQSPNEHEAQAAMNAAQKLMLKYNIENEATKKKAKPQYSFMHLGKPTGRVQESDRVLADILIRYFFVEAIWVPVYRPFEKKKGTVLEICGSLANLEMASYVHSFLTDTAERLWKEHKRKQRITGDKDRRSFISGVMLGFRDKLKAQEKVNEEQGLIWLKDAQLDDYFGRRFPKIRKVSYRGGPVSDAFGHGRAAGQNIDLHRPMNSQREHNPRLLTTGN